MRKRAQPAGGRHAGALVAACVAACTLLISSGAVDGVRAALAPLIALDVLILSLVATAGGLWAVRSELAGWRVAQTPRRRPFERLAHPLPGDGAPLHVAAIGFARNAVARSAPSHARRLRDALQAAYPDACFDQVSAERIVVAFAVPDQAEAKAKLARLRGTGETTLALLFGPGQTLTMGLAGPVAAGDLRRGTEAAMAALESAERAGLPLAIDDPADARRAAEQASLMRDLADAIHADTLSLAYQPKLCARTGAIDSLEALARWTDPVRGEVTPSYFVPIAEELGQVRALTEWVIGRAITDGARFAAANVARRIYVNVSAGLVADSAFADWLLDRLVPHAATIGIEITETAVLSDPDRALAHLDRLAAAGISIAIDDYGAGLSSLSYLKRLPAKELKIDMMFIRDMATSHRDPMIVRSTIDLAHGLGLRVTAEGVDKPETLALLRVMGCDLLQGYQIARPMPADALIDYLVGHDPAQTDMHQAIGLTMMQAATAA